MSEITTEEGWLTTSDGAKLFTKSWKPSSQPTARLVFIHGFSDHIDFYGILFPRLASQGIAVYAFDQRGWGRSVFEPSQKGATGPTSRVLSDITEFIQSVPRDDDVPLFLMGHSMGGAEVLHYAASGPKDVLSRIRGFLCESPFVALHPSAKPWKATVVLGRLAGRLMPKMQMVQKLDSNKLSRDPETNKAFEDDPLCHDTGTLEGLAGMLDRAQELEEGKVVVKDGVGEGGKTRLWVGHGSADEVCGFEACRKWFEGCEVKDKEMRVYEGWFHKLHAEPGRDKEVFAEDVTGWVLERAGRGGDERERSKL